MKNSSTSDEGTALETTINANGRESSSALLSSPGGVDHMYIGPRQAIPVIFVPGIMGSPLIAVGQQPLFEDQGPWAWFPDGGKSWMVDGYGSLTAAQRRGLLSPAKTKAVERASEGSRETVRKHLTHATIALEEAMRRGWGSVMISSYGGILNYLENQLQYIFFRGNIYPGTQAARPRDPSAWGDVRGYERLDDEQLRKAAGWRFPVYAVGYNWMDSNGAAANYLKRRIDEVRADCRTRLKLKCDKVILVTHSMGGLVARMCAKRNPSDVLGVVHGVQPAVGAATAYARVRTGWDSNVSITRPLASIVSMVGAWALGPSGAEVAAVFANGPGPLELLPNQLYGSGWFKTYAEDGRREIFSLPERDPYEEIYRVADKWWRLVHPGTLVRPADLTNRSILHAQWLDFSGKLDKAKEFHRSLGTYYHPSTYAHCGADSSQKAWHEVGWRLQPLHDISTGIWAKSIPSEITARDKLRLTQDRMHGTCTIQDVAAAGPTMYMRHGQGVTSHYGGDIYRAWLTSKDSAGDATVPANSGLAPLAYSKFFARMQGFEHQDSYNNENVRSLTLYSVLQLASRAASLL